MEVPGKFLPQFHIPSNVPQGSLSKLKVSIVGLNGNSLPHTSL